MTKRFGFTLAEVLITLGIIGVVAAMTMPTLMNSTQGAQYRAAYKKALSALSQAVTLNVALDEWNFSDLSTSDEDYQITKMLTDRMNVVRTEVGPTNVKVGSGEGDTYTAANGGETGLGEGDLTIAEGNTTLFFNDGIMFTFPTAPSIAGCTRVAGSGELNDISAVDAAKTSCYGFIDVNGLKGPNKVVKCDTGKADGSEVCQVTNPTDVYPVIFYDQSVLPSTEPARAVLYGK